MHYDGILVNDSDTSDLKDMTATAKCPDNETSTKNANMTICCVQKCGF